ncbi:MAG TPA: branched-chain amino acid ABC transporter permease [Candidatus Acidoferrales bacterium]|nr:branched-chain amino acid ABC transporter permease [Candidatus Acidoferrales bacterium]
MLIQQIGNGVFLGAVYALFACGYALVFGVLDILNLAHAAIYMSAAFIALALAGAGVPLLLAIVLAIIAAGLLGILLDRVAFAPLRRRNAGTLAPLISSIGVAIMIQGIARAFFGSDDQPFPSGTFATAQLQIGSLRLGVVDVTVLGVAIAMMLALSSVLRFTSLGRSIRAVAADRIAAALLGIDVERTIALTFFIASALGGAAGVLIGLEFNSVSVDMGARIELKGLAIIVLGGMGSVTGAVVGALLLGCVETLSVAYISSGYRDAISFGVMFLVLVLRPTGLFGRRSLRAA